MMKITLLKLGLGYSKGHKLQTLLLVLGVAVGVAVVVAIDLANNSISRSFQLSTRSLSNNVSHQILGTQSGIPQSVYRKLRVDMGFRFCAPVISRYVGVKELNWRRVRLLGIDPLAAADLEKPTHTGDNSKSRFPMESTTQSPFITLITKPNTVMISEESARKFNLAPGCTLHLHIAGKDVLASIAGVLSSSNHNFNEALSGILLTDIATAQEILEMGEKISYIQLNLDPENTEMLAKIKSQLPPGLQVVPIDQKNIAIRQMSRAFELNLTAFSLLALFVGMFLIYNTITFSVVQRHYLMGTLRALGVTRREIFWMIIWETLIFGLVGTFLGLLLGILLGVGVVRLVIRTVSDLYFPMTVYSFAISSLSLLKGIILGLLASFLSSLLPAREAAMLAPAKVLQRSTQESRVLRFIPGLTIGGIFILLLGTVGLCIPSRRLELGFGGLFFVMVGMLLLVPLMVLVLDKMASPLVVKFFNVPGKIAFRDVSRSLSRTAVSIAALMAAIAVIIGVDTMVASFRYTVINWLEDTFKADIYITGVKDANFTGTLKQFPGIKQIYPIHMSSLTAGNYPNSLLLVLEREEGKRKWRWRIGNEPLVTKCLNEGWVLISETFAWKHRISAKPGSNILLNTDRGMQAFPIAGIFTDFFTQQGTIVMKKKVYQEYWDDYRVSGIGIKVKPGVNVETLMQRINDGFSDKPFVITSHRNMKRIALDVFDRTFTITIALQILATIVAFIGILNTIMSFMLEKMREIGILRANGMTLRQLWRMIMTESGIIGFFSGLLALPLGTILAWILVLVVNKRSFGWTLDFILQPEIYLQAILTAIVAALLAGIYPAYAIGKIKIARALRTE
jgi:putative ABC transport system permease protein